MKPSSHSQVQRTDFTLIYLRILQAERLVGGRHIPTVAGKSLQKKRYVYAKRMPLHLDRQQANALRMSLTSLSAVDRKIVKLHRSVPDAIITEFFCHRELLWKLLFHCLVGKCRGENISRLHAVYRYLSAAMPPQGLHAEIETAMRECDMILAQLITPFGEL